MEPKTCTRQKLIEIDVLSQRYSKLPSEISKIDAADYQFNLLVAETAINNEAKIRKRTSKNG